VVLPYDGPLASRLRALDVRVILHGGLAVISRPLFRPWRLLALMARLPLSIGRLAALMRTEEIGIVHTNTGVVLESGAAARLAGVPHVWHIRDWFQEFRSLWRPYARYILATSDRVVTVSEAVATQFGDRSRVRVIHNGIPIDESDPPRAQLAALFRERFPGPLPRPVVGCVGRIKMKRKGQDSFVRAAAELVQRGHDATFLIVGGTFAGNERHLTQLEELVRSLGLEQRVQFVGELEDVRPAYAVMDISVLPSDQPEPFAGVVLESMSMGLPVVATRTGGSPEQVVDGVTGLLVPPSDPTGMADAISRLLREPQLRAKMGAAGRERVEREFSIEATVASLQRLYDDLTGL